MFERFTDCARHLLRRANEEALKLRHNYLGTEHILLGLAKEDKSVGVHVLQGLGIDFKQLEQEVKKLSPPGPENEEIEILRPDDREKHVIQYAIEEARKLKHSYIGSEHLLLGLVREKDGVAAKVFDIMKIDYQKMKEQILKTLESAHQDHTEAAAESA